MELREIVERSLEAEYEVLSLIGRGGMGAVYLARERRLHRLVAIKVLPPDHESGRDRFLREARTVAKLSHPGIVSLHSFGETDQLTYFVMDYIRGESLADRLRTRGRLGPDETRRMLTEVASALEHAHRNGIVHRDIKPENILIEEESGRMMVTDFGIARVAGATTTLTADGMLVGTPRYMSPEQATGQSEIDARSDIYSLGLVAYTMLAGKPPFDADDVRVLIADHAVSEPVPLMHAAPETPLALATIVMRCLAKEPADRWPSARELRDALGERPPEAIEDWEKALRGGALRVGLGVLAVANIALTLALTPLSSPIPSLITLALGVFAIRWLMSAVNPAILRRRYGVAPDVVRRGFVMPPVDWIGWWPARWRPESDVFARLPTSLRRRRIAYVIVRGGGLLVAEFFFLAFIIGSERGTLRQSLSTWLWFLGAGTAVVTLVCGFGLLKGTRAFFRQARAGGLQRADVLGIISRPTFDRAFWQRPEIARVLVASRQATSADVEQAFDPRTYLNRVESVARALDSSNAAIGQELLSLARQAVETCDAIASELATLERDHQPEELARVEERLREISAAEAAPSERGAAMQSLLNAQRDLLRETADRLEVLRIRLAEMRRTLRSHDARIERITAGAGVDSSRAKEVALLVGELRPLFAPELHRAATRVGV